MALSFLDKIIGFISRPAETFRAVRGESLKDAAIYYLLLLIFTSVLAGLMVYLGFTRVNGSVLGITLGPTAGIMSFVWAVIFFYLWGLLTLVVWAIVLQIGAKALGGRGELRRRVQGGRLCTDAVPALRLDPGRRLASRPALGGRADRHRRARALRSGDREGRYRGRGRFRALHHGVVDPLHPRLCDGDGPRRHLRPHGLIPPSLLSSRATPPSCFHASGGVPQGPEPGNARSSRPSFDALGATTTLRGSSAVSRPFIRPAIMPVRRRGANFYYIPHERWVCR